MEVVEGEGEGWEAVEEKVELEEEDGLENKVKKEEEEFGFLRLRCWM